MREVIVVCEGHTEREFCRSVMRPFVAQAGIALGGTLVGKPQRKRGGIRPWPVYRSEILRIAKERSDRHVAVLVDYYAMPDSWPGRNDAAAKPIAERGKHVEAALIADLLGELGTSRFHPCVQLHEFESLLFVEPELSALSIAIGSGLNSHDFLAKQMLAIRRACGDSVEQIDDSPQSAPSKRIAQLVIGYDKVAWGVTAAADVEIPALRAGCPWLDRWITRLESVGGGP